MIAVRWGMLVAATLLILAVFGALAPDLQPSALRVAVTAVVGLLAPFFWPGRAATPTRTALRIAAWSAAAACVAAIALGIGINPGQPFPRILAACTMLMLILLVTHAVAAGIEEICRQSGDAGSAREMAGRTAAIVLALLGSLPLWLGPAGELLAGGHPWVIDAVVGVSPLTHLAVASGNDLLRNQWFYQHSNLAALQFSYPDLTELTLYYSAACLVLAVIVPAPWRSRRLIAGATGNFFTTEETKR